MIFKAALVLLKTLIVYILLVLIQEDVLEKQFQEFYYIVVCVSIYVWLVDFGVFFYTSKHGVEISADKITRNVLIQLLLSPIAFFCLSFYFTQTIAAHIITLCVMSYLLLILRASLISKSKMTNSLLVDYFSLVPFYALFYIYSELQTALFFCTVIQMCLLALSYRSRYLSFKRPELKFDRFDKQMLISNLFSLPGSYVDVLFARYFVADFSTYILIREAVMKIPSLLLPIYNNLVYPVLLVDFRSFDRFFIANAVLYISIFVVGWFAAAFFPEPIQEISRLLSILVFLKGLSSLHGALMMSQMASHLSMIKNAIYFIGFVCASGVSLKLGLDFNGWAAMLVGSYGVALSYDMFILFRLKVMSVVNSSLISTSYILGFLLCINY